MAQQRTILCYGDSNTWGYVPNDFTKNTIISRFSRDVRWTGLLQTLLGKNYYVVEEGLNGRTTNVDYHIAPDRNGKTYLPSCLYSHAPIDLVILSLGGNDLKSCFNRSVEQIADGLTELIDIIGSSPYGHDMLSPPKVLILTIPIPYQIAEQFLDENSVYIFKNSIDKCKSLTKEFASIALVRNCEYLDTTEIRPSQIDGIHYDKDAHEKLATIISTKIKSIFNVI